MKRLTVELPPITEVWREVGIIGGITPPRQKSHMPSYLREQRAKRILADVRFLVSLEEVFGGDSAALRGLLARFNFTTQAHCPDCGVGWNGFMEFYDGPHCTKKGFPYVQRWHV